MDYNHIEELVRSIKKGNELSKLELLKEFKPYVLSYISKSYIKGYDKNDLENECYLALLNSINSYDCNKHRFIAYGLCSIKNRLKYLYKLSKNKDVPEEAIMFNYNEESDTIMDNSLLTEDIIILRENLKKIKSTLECTSPEYYNLFHKVIINKMPLSSYSKKYNINYYNAYKMKKDILRIIYSLNI